MADRFAETTETKFDGLWCKMPRFFFDIDTEEADSVGVELPDYKAARSEAITAAGEILRDIDGSLGDQGWTMRVRDHAGEYVLELRFAVTEKRQP